MIQTATRQQGTLPTVTFSQGSTNIRALIHRMSGREDPLAEWKSNLDEWIEEISVFREAENENFFQETEVNEISNRFHRLILHSLIAKGEALAIDLLTTEDGEAADKATQLEYVEAFIDNLRMTLIAFHRSKKPDTRSARLAAYL